MTHSTRLKRLSVFRRVPSFSSPSGLPVLLNTYYASTQLAITREGFLVKKVKCTTATTTTATTTTTLATTIKELEVCACS